MYKIKIHYQFNRIDWTDVRVSTLEDDRENILYKTTLKGRLDAIEAAHRFLRWEDAFRGMDLAQFASYVEEHPDEFILEVVE